MTGSARTALVSVVTPCRDAAAFVGETIDSVRAQTHRPLEHIVVDDASADASREVVARHGNHVRAIHLVTPSGAPHARNVGAGRARGRFLMFLDADDLLAPDAIEGMVEAVRDGSSRAAAVCPWRELRQAGGGWATMAPEIPFPPPRDALRGWLDGVWVPPCAVLWTRAAYERTGGWDETLSVNQDGDLMLRALIDGLELRVASTGPSLYRRHDPAHHSVSRATYSAVWLRDQVRVLDGATARLAARGEVREYAIALGRVYRQFGLLASVHGAMPLADRCLRTAEQLAGPRVAPRTLLGRVLTRLLGPGRKEQLAMALAHLGVMTGERQRFVQRHAPPDAVRHRGAS